MRNSAPLSGGANFEPLSVLITRSAFASSAILYPHSQRLPFLVSLTLFLPCLQQLDDGFLHPLGRIAFREILPQGVRGKCHSVQITFLFLTHDDTHHIEGQIPNEG